MKSVIKSLKVDKVDVWDVPVPDCRPMHCLVQSSLSLISSGTERTLLDFTRSGVIQKVRQHPDKVRAIVEKVRADGVVSTYESVMRKLDEPVPLGYCNVGRVLICNSDGKSFLPGDRVVSNGKHADIVSVPFNLCAKIPAAVTDEEASFTVLGAIALQGIRLANPTLGETVVVTGLGLVGLLSVQLLRANGCRVLGLDFDRRRLDLAQSFGAEVVDLSSGVDPVVAANVFSRGHGIDAVIITAATHSSEPVHQAALMSRKRGRIILVGVTGLELSRDDFFKKELTFQVSASYGPGRYDPNYEEKGQDYPFGFVRWTEQRNFEAVLDMMADHRLDVKPLISHRFAIDEAERAYEVVGGSEPSLGILLTYSGVDVTPESRTVQLVPQDSKAGGTVDIGVGAVGVSFVGAGNYSTGVLIPAFKSAGAKLRSVASSSGISGVYAGRKFGFEETTTDTARLFTDAASEALVVTTRHDSHARFVCQALRAGKHVFVEKPLCVGLDELEMVEQSFADSRCCSMPVLMVGFNRRFAPHVQKIHQLLQATPGPKAFVITVNAGVIPADHWTQDPLAGGGRLIGEGCHFIDLLRFLAGSPITGWQRTEMQTSTRDTFSLQLSFADGSVGTVHYFASGSKAYPKERVEVFASGRVLQLDNFRKLSGWGWPGFRRMNLWRQDKGQLACVAAFLEAVRTGVEPIPFEELLEVARVTIEAAGQQRASA